MSCDNREVQRFRAWDDLPQWWREGYGYQWRAFAEALREPASAPRGFERELITMEMCAEAVASAGVLAG